MLIFEITIVYFASPEARRIFGMVKDIGQKKIFATIQVRITPTARERASSERLKALTRKGQRIKIVVATQNIPR